MYLSARERERAKGSLHYMMNRYGWLNGWVGGKENGKLLVVCVCILPYCDTASDTVDK